MLNKENGHLTKDATLPQARATDLVTREMPDEVLVYDLKRHKAHCLNQTAAMVWKHCDGRRTMTDIARLIEKDLNTVIDEETVWLAVDSLGKAHLLEERVTAPAGSPRVSRRNAIRKLGLGVAIVAPMVMSIVAPTAVSAQTCLANGMACSPTGTNTMCCSQCCSGVSGCFPAMSLAMGSLCTVGCACSSGTCSGFMCT